MNINFNYLLTKHLTNVKIVCDNDVINSNLAFSDKDTFIVTWRDLKRCEDKIKNCILILINIEPLPHMKEAMDALFKYKEKISFVIDYSIKNMMYLTKNFPKIRTFYIPMCYTKILENQIFYKQRQYTIDVHMYGEMNKRRTNFIDKLMKIKPNIKIIARQKYGSIIEQNRRSCMVKISPIIFTNPEFKHFDHYRCAYLLTKKCLVVHEQIDIENENDKELCDNLIFCSYNDMPNKINDILKLSDEDIYKIALKQYEYYKQNWDMEKLFIKSQFLEQL